MNKKYPISILVFLSFAFAVQLNCTKKDFRDDQKQIATEAHVLKTNDSIANINDAAIKPKTDPALDTVPMSKRERKRPPISPTNKVEKPLNGAEPPSLKTSVAGTASTTGYDCGSGMNGNYYGSGYYRYPDYVINLRAPVGTVNIYLTSYDVPNRFSIYDGSGNYVAGTGWMGYSTNSGPWGGYLNTQQSQTISFQKTQGTYFLRVETVTSDYSDGWNANISCATPPSTTIQLENFFYTYDRSILLNTDSTVLAPYMIQKNRELLSYLSQNAPATYNGSIDPNDPILTVAGLLHMYCQGIGHLSTGTGSTLSFNDFSPKAVNVSGLAISMAGLYAIADNTYYFKLDWGCVWGVIAGIVDITALYKSYASMIRNGATWGTVRSVIWQSVKRYGGWIMAAHAIYEIGTECF